MFYYYSQYIKGELELVPTKASEFVSFLCFSLEISSCIRTAICFVRGSENVCLLLVGYVSRGSVCALRVVLFMHCVCLCMFPSCDGPVFVRCAM